MSPRAATTEAQVPKAHAPQQEKPLQWEAQASQLEGSPHTQQLEKAHEQEKRPSTTKNN